MMIYSFLERCKTFKMFALNIVLLVFYAATTHGARRVVCDFDDDACMTYGARMDFLTVVTGMKGLWEQSDPMFIPHIAGKTDTLAYQFWDYVMEGMQGCEVTLGRIDTKTLRYNYNIYCKELTVKGRYQLEGTLGNRYVEGHGTCRNTLYRYHMNFEGGYETYIDKDGNQYMNLKNTEVSFKCDDRVVYDFDNLFYDDRQRAREFHDWGNKNWRFVDSTVGKQVMARFAEKFIDNVNAHLTVVPMNEIFYRYQ